MKTILWKNEEKLGSEYFSLIGNVGKGTIIYTDEGEPHTVHYDTGAVGTS